MGTLRFAVFGATGMMGQGTLASRQSSLFITQEDPMANLAAKLAELV